MNLLTVDNVSKNFGAVKALDSVSLSVRKGEVLGLAGENGAGKSTLIKLLCGVYKQEKGSFSFDGKPLSPRDPSEAEESGISVFHQEIPVCPNLSISANVFLGNKIPSKGIFPDWDVMNRKTTELFMNLLGEEIMPDRLIKNCSVAEQQLALLVRVLSRDAKLVILDEPTTALTPPEVTKLFRIINRLKNQGITFIFVSHMLDELIALSDRITVLRDGKNVGELEKKSFNAKRISSLIAGRELDYSARISRKASSENILEIKNIESGKTLRDLSFTLKKGEILGIAGLQGSGRSTAARVLFGIEKSHKGEIRIRDKKVLIESPQDAIKNKIGYVPEDRKTLGLFMQMDIKNNIFISQIDSAKGFMGMINTSKIRKTAEEISRKLSVKMSSSDAPITSLSGGNQQKILISRWLSIKPEILVMNEPTRGVDVGAKEDICKLVRNLAHEGYSFVIASSEIEELMAMSDRILVMRKGIVSGEISRDDFSKEKIIYAATAE